MGWLLTGRRGKQEALAAVWLFVVNIGWLAITNSHLKSQRPGSKGVFSLCTGVGMVVVLMCFDLTEGFITWERFQLQKQRQQLTSPWDLCGNSGQGCGWGDWECRQRTNSILRGKREA